jgi:hypothetical protein
MQPADRDTTPLEMHTQRFEDSREHKRQWLESLDRPLECHGLLESFFVWLGDKRSPIFSARNPLQLQTTVPQATEQLSSWEGSKFTQGLDPPSLHYG